MFESPDVDTIYEIPFVLYNQNFDKTVINRLGITDSYESGKSLTLGIDFKKEAFLK